MIKVAVGGEPANQLINFGGCFEKRRLVYPLILFELCIMQTIPATHESFTDNYAIKLMQEIPVSFLKSISLW